MYFKIGQKYPATVTEFKERGVVVRLEDGSTKFIHLSKISDEYVKNCQDYLTLNAEYEVECVESTVRPFELSFLHLKLKSSKYSKNSSDSKDIQKPLNSHETAGKKKYYKTPESNSSNSSSSSNSKDSQKLYESADSRLEAMITASNKAFRDKTGLDAGKVTKNRRRGHRK